MIKELIKAFTARLTVAIEEEQERQLKVSYERGELLKKYNGYKFDGPAIDMVFSMELDYIERELSDQVMHEEITEEQKDEIFEAIQ